MEGFPRGQWKDQVDSSTGAFNKLSQAPASVSIASIG
jgi:phage terminase large subunit-like protein